MESGDAEDRPATRVAIPAQRSETATRARVIVLSGPQEGRALDLGPGRHVVGAAADGALALTDPLVSRQHLAILVGGADGLRIADLASTNGSYFQGARFESIEVEQSAVVVVGQTQLKIVRDPPPEAVAAGAGAAGLVAASARMRSVVAALEKVAGTDLTVLVEGEPGTGKERIAETIHRASRRSAGPFVICDLEGLSSGRLEQELFGVAGGALPGESATRDGAFALAEGGTLLLKEISTIPADFQLRLLHALERRKVQAVGAAEPRRPDVRLVVASRRDLSLDVREGRFKADLFHRLGGFRISVPPLRERREDLPHLIEQILREASAGQPVPAVSEATLAALAAHDWPGNVRQLRAVLERALVLASDAESLDLDLLGIGTAASTARPAQGPGQELESFKQAKERLIESWEREYLTRLLQRARGNISLAARRAGLNRPYLHELLRKHQLIGAERPPVEEE